MAVWSGPASATGGRLETVMATASEEEAEEPSCTVRLKANMPGPAGAANVGDATAPEESATVSPAACTHEYVSVSPVSGSVEPEPSSVTISPGLAVWSGPASATGGRLETVMSSGAESGVSTSKAAVAEAPYPSLATTTRLTVLGPLSARMVTSQEDSSNVTSAVPGPVCEWSTRYVSGSLSGS